MGFIYLFLLPVMLPSVIPKLPTDPPVRWFPTVWKILLLYDSLPRKVLSEALITPKLLTAWITTNWKILDEMGIPDHLTYLLRNLYAGQEATFRTGHETIDWLHFRTGVCHGCILSLCLFILTCRVHVVKCWIV